TGRTLCLNMEKKEPDESVSYWPAACEDLVIARLALDTNASRNTGAWDQARVWIYTDNASLSDINKRLQPPLIPGYYTRGLYDVDRFGGFTDKERKNAKLFSPELLFAPTGNPKASQYFFSNMSKNFA